MSDSEPDSKRRKVDAVPFESIPIAEALMQCRPQDKENWASDLSILGLFRVESMAEWAALSSTSKEQMIKRNLPEVVIQALDKWVALQPGRYVAVLRDVQAQADAEERLPFMPQVHQRKNQGNRDFA